MNLVELNTRIALVAENYDKFHKFLLHLGSLFGIDEGNASLINRKPDEAWSDYDRTICLLRQIRAFEGQHILNLMIPRYCDDEYLDILYRIPKDITSRLDKMNGVFQDPEESREIRKNLSNFKELCHMYSIGSGTPTYIEYAFDRNKSLNTKEIKVYIRHICDNIIDILFGDLHCIGPKMANYMPSIKINNDVIRVIRYAARYDWMLELKDEIEDHVNLGKSVFSNDESGVDEKAQFLD